MLRRNRKSLVAVSIVAVILAGAAIVEGDVPEDLTHIGSLVIGLLNRFGAAACLALLYFEESGIPLPVPGDFYVAFMGRLNAGSMPHLLVAWLAIIAVVSPPCAAVRMNTPLGMRPIALPTVCLNSSLTGMIASCSRRDERVLRLKPWATRCKAKPRANSRARTADWAWRLRRARRRSV